MFHFVTWIFFANPVFGSEAVIYIQKLEGESVIISCESEEKGSAASGLVLKHKFPHPEMQVAFISAEGQVMENHPYCGRVAVHGEGTTGPLNVTVSQLQYRDTGIYFCEFTHLGQTVPGTREVFVSVEMTEIHCHCSRYAQLLYAISGAMVFLLLAVTGPKLAKFGKTRTCYREQSPVPIYEDMTAAQVIHRQSIQSDLENHENQNEETSLSC